MRSLFARKPIKIAAITVGVLAVLATAFFLAPGSGPASGGTNPQSIPSTVTTDGVELPFSIPTLPDMYAGLAQALDGALATRREMEQLPQTDGTTQTIGTTTQPGKTTESIFTASSTVAGTSAGRVTAAPQATTVSATAATSTVSSIITTKYTYTTSTKASTSGSSTTTAAQPASSSTSTTTAQRNPTVTISIRCDTAVGNDKLRAGKAPYVPSNGIIMSTRTVSFTQGETVFNVLQRETRAAGIQMEFSNNPMFNSVYIEGINNLYEFDCGELSGWMYKVNGVFPNYGCSSYTLKQGDVIEWVYTCDLGNDVGGGYATGTQR